MNQASGASALRTFLEGRGGAAAWREWMEAALYDPQRGYYTAQIRTVGRGGDFSTSASLNAALPGAIARWIVSEWTRAGRRLPLIECGPGDGTLHRRVLQALGFRRRWGLRTHLVERSPVLRAQQQAVLKGWPRPQWHTGMQEALTACGGEALIFSNELADAFPATLLQWTGSAWQEVWLELTEQGGIVEALRDLLEPVESTACALSWPQGQRIEVLESYRHWLNDWRAAWRSGAMLTIDYGGTAEEIYHRRPGGTARGFLRHQRLDATQLYAAMGRCDVTVDVNFPDLIAWGQAAGLETVACMTQREFSGSSDAGPEEDAFQCLIQRPL